MADRNDKGQIIGPYKGGRVSGWERGMDNRLSSIDIPSDILRNAVNVDVLTSGKVRRRRGIVQRAASAGAHSMFSDNVRMLWATANELKLMNLNFVQSTLLTDVRLASRLSMVTVNNETYFVNESITGKVKADNTHEAWGVTGPTQAPTCVSLDTAPLNIQYQVTCTFVLASGEESGAPIGRKVVGGADGVISLTNIPVSSDSRVSRVCIYVSDMDGTVFYKYVDLPNGTTTFLIRGPYGTGKKLMTQFMEPMPPGQLVEYYNGRLYVAVGNVVVFTDALRYGLYRPDFNFYMFPERVTLLKAVDDGLYISSDITYFLGGDPKVAAKPSAASVDLMPVLPYKAIEGAACDLSYAHDVMWLSERGFVRGGAGGKVTNLTEDHIAMDAATRGCIGMMETNGLKSVVAIMRESTTNPIASNDYVEVENERIEDTR